MMYDIANVFKTAEASRLLNQSKAVPRPYRNLDEERMRWQMKTIQFDMSKEERKALPKTSILSSDIHSCKTSFEELKPITLSEMKVPRIHIGRYLVCQVIGDVEEVEFYNFCYNLDDLDWLMPGTIFVVKEPRLRYCSYNKSVSMRIDSPSDVIFVDCTDYELLEKIGAKKMFVPMSKDAEVWREKANEVFKKGNYRSALNMYNRGIRYNPELPVLYLNKALTCLRTGAFYEAYEAAEFALEKNGDREKALFRMGQAAYGMREWQKAADHFTEVLKDFPKNASAVEQLKRATFRLSEQKDGNYDFKMMYSESKKEKADLDVSDFEGPIEIANIPGKSRGIIASEDIKMGTLLVVSKAFASGYSQDFPGLLITVNLIRKDSGTAAQMLQATRAMLNLQYNPQKAKEVYDLYAGDTQNEEIPFGVIDAARIQQISVYNAFASDDLSPDKKAELINMGMLSQDNVHLFILPSYFNHSCLANAHRTFYGNVMVIHANMDIKKGDEICLAYINPMTDFLVRKKTLNKWKFVCQCKLCELDAKEKQCEKRDQMVAEFNEYIGKHSAEEIIVRGETVLKKVRKSYDERNKFKLKLAEMLVLLSPRYFTLNNPKKSIKYLEEALTLMDNSFKYALSVAHICVNLAACYHADGKTEKVKELIEKAFKESLCTDMDHFKILFPETATLLP
uniref:SET domain-containing protein n=1 Tax=Panagrolaimus sp. PS1159 TaxID=55785 RepID=A0AC35F2E6_9BILA